MVKDFDGKKRCQTLLLDAAIHISVNCSTILMQQKNKFIIIWTFNKQAMFKNLFLVNENLCFWNNQKNKNKFLKFKEKIHKNQIIPGIPAAVETPAPVNTIIFLHGLCWIYNPNFSNENLTESLKI